MSDELTDKSADDRDKKRHKKTKGMIVHGAQFGEILRQRVLRKKSKPEEKKDG